MKERQVYEDVFKLEIAKMVVDQGLSMLQASKDLGIGITSVRR